MLILKGKVLLEKYFDNDLENDTFLAVSASGYSNDELAMKYLIHFYNNTFKKTKGRWRILIFDGYSSYISAEFLHYCWEYKIIPFQLPLHSTHLLQPLNIGLFQPLKHWHQFDIQNIIQFSNCEYTKIDFLNVYRKIRANTFKVRTIKSA